jgi:transcriptional regulator with XRE-family HTH domain
MRVVNPFAAAVGRRVRAEMDHQHIRQTAVARRLGISQAAVNRRLSGEIAFNVAELAAVARLLDVDICSFLVKEQTAVAA